MYNTTRASGGASIREEASSRDFTVVAHRMNPESKIWNLSQAKVTKLPGAITLNHTWYTCLSPPGGGGLLIQKVYAPARTALPNPYPHQYTFRAKIHTLFTNFSTRILKKIIPFVVQLVFYVNWPNFWSPKCWIHEKNWRVAPKIGKNTLTLFEFDTHSLKNPTHSSTHLSPKNPTLSSTNFENPTLSSTELPIQLVKTIVSDCQKLLSPAGHFELPAGHLIEFNRRPLPDIW